MPQRVDRLRGRGTIGDEQVNLFDLGDERDVAADELGRVGDHHDLLRDPDHLGVELGFLQMRGHDADFRI